MKKLLIAATAVLVSSSPVFLLPMEKELTLTPKQVQNLSQNTIASLSQFKQIPKNPRTITNILTYKNKELTEFKTSIKADTKLSISAIFWNAKGEPVFQLQDGDFVAASQKLIIDDSVYNQKDVYKRQIFVKWMRLSMSFVPSMMKMLCVNKGARMTLWIRWLISIQST